jgi:hypothetical protein
MVLASPRAQPRRRRARVGARATRSARSRCPRARVRTLRGGAEARRRSEDGGRDPSRDKRARPLRARPGSIRLAPTAAPAVGGGAGCRLPRSTCRRKARHREQVVGDRPEGVDFRTDVGRVRLEDGLRSHPSGEGEACRSRSWMLSASSGGAPSRRARSGAPQPRSGATSEVRPLLGTSPAPPYLARRPRSRTRGRVCPRRRSARGLP